MAPPLQTAVRSAAATLQQSAGVTISYRRGAASVTLTAVPGRTPFEQTTSTGMLLQFESRDWLITASELLLDSVVVTPQLGDEIRETVGAVTHIYRVLEHNGQPAWRYCDQYRTRLRVHTKHHTTE